jgi:hypothetical protein
LNQIQNRRIHQAYGFNYNNESNKLPSLVKNRDGDKYQHVSKKLDNWNHDYEKRR